MCIISLYGRIIHKKGKAENNMLKGADAVDKGSVIWYIEIVVIWSFFGNGGL